LQVADNWGMVISWCITWLLVLSNSCDVKGPREGKHIVGNISRLRTHINYQIIVAYHVSCSHISNDC